MLRRGNTQRFWPRSRWAVLAACCGAAASAVALGALTAGVAVAEGGTAARWPVIASAPRLSMAPPAPTDAQRAVAREAARLAFDHPAHEMDASLADAPRRLARPVQRPWQRPGQLTGFIDLSSYGLGPVPLDDGMGTIMQVALQLYLAGHEGAVREMDAALRISRDPFKAPARYAIPVLLGDAPPPQREGRSANLSRANAMAMALAASAERALWTTGQVEPARPAVLAVFQYIDAALASTMRDPSQYEPVAGGHARAAIINWLVAAGRLEDAHRFSLDQGGAADCMDMRVYAELAPLLDSLAMAGHWPQLMELVAASNRLCLNDFLKSRAAGLALDAGQRDALLGSLRTALARPVRTDQVEPDVIAGLAVRGFLEEAEQELAVSRAAGKRLNINGRALLAAAAVVAGDRPRLDRHWVALDQVTSGQADIIAEYVVVAAVMAGMATGDWRSRAVDWLGVEEADLDRAVATHVTLIDPSAARHSPALAALVNRALDCRCGREVGRLHTLRLYREADLRLAVWNRDEPLHEAAWFRSLDTDALVDLADAAAGWYNDPAALGELLTLIEARVLPIIGDRGNAPGTDRDFPRLKSAGLCFVAVRALDQPGLMPQAAAMLAGSDLFQNDSLQDYCRVRAAAVLALRGHADDALRVARATVDPALRALALAHSLAAPLPPELVAWHDRMRGRGPVAEMMGDPNF